MGKSRRGRALFDLLDQEQAEAAERLKIPSWWDGHRTGEAQPEAPIRMSSGSESPPPGPAMPGAESAPLAEFDGGFLRFRLSSTMAAAAAFALLAILVTVYQAGRHLGFQAGARRGYEDGRIAALASPDAGLSAARQQAPATHLIASLGTTGAASPGVTPKPGNEASKAEVAPGGELSNPGSPWVRDRTYVVVQEFRADRAEDAEKARQFLEEHGVIAEQVALAGGGWQLITRQGFDRTDSAQREQADELLRKIHQLGGEYYTAGGGYKLEGYFRTLKNDRW